MNHTTDNEPNACDLCGEELVWMAASEADVWGMFTDPSNDSQVTVHSQCGVDAGFDLA